MSSTALQRMLRLSASRYTDSLRSPSEVAATTRNLPSRSLGSKSLGSQSISRFRTDSASRDESLGETTVTRAPACTRPRILEVAIVPPPTTRTGRSLSLRNAGKSVMRAPQRNGGSQQPVDRAPQVQRGHRQESRG